MNSTTLSPPQPLSDVIIGEVVPRSSGRRSGQVVAADYMYSTTTYSKQLASSRYTLKTVQVVSESTPTTLSHFVSTAAMSNTMLKPITNIRSSRINANRQRGVATAKVKDAAETQQQILASILQTAPELLDDLSRSYARDRKERRQYQRRYRKKFVQITAELELDIRGLRKQIHQHELKRHLLVFRSPPSVITPWKVVSEYFRLFRHGFKGPQPPNSTSKPTKCEQGDIQMNFLNKVMAPDVSVNSGFGVDTLINEWIAVPQVHRDMTVRLFRLGYDEDNLVLATITVSTTITEAMLRCEFPYFSDRNKDSTSTRLMKKLVGQNLVIPTTVRFEWDSGTHRVLSMHYSADLVVPFLKLLGSMQDAARVLDDSLLSIATSACSTKT